MALKLVASSTLVVKIAGPNRSAFINSCSDMGVPLWQVTPHEDGVTAVTTVSGFGQMRKPARATGTAVTVLERRGASYLNYKVRKRLFFALGGVMFIVLLQVLSSFVWLLQVDQSEHVEQAELHTALHQAGVHIGARKSLIEGDAVSNAILSQFPDLVWVSISIKGSRLHVRVVDRALVELPSSQAGDVIASKPGVILKVIATSGQAMVNSGETVARGQTLISGAITVDGNVMSEVRAEGLVEARVWYESMHTVYMQRAVGRATGARAKAEIISIANGSKITLMGHSDPPYHHFELEERRRVLLPGVEHISRIYREIILEKEAVDPASALHEALTAARVQIHGLFPEESGMIVSEQVNHELLDDILTVRVLFEVVEDIGSFKPYPALRN